MLAKVCAWSMLRHIICRCFISSYAGKPSSRPTHHSRFTPFSVSRLLFRVRNTKMSFKWNEKRQKNTAKEQWKRRQAKQRNRFSFALWPLFGWAFRRHRRRRRRRLSRPIYAFCKITHSSREVLCEMAEQRPSRARATRGCKTKKKWELNLFESFVRLRNVASLCWCDESSVRTTRKRFFLEQKTRWKKICPRPV